MPTLTKPVQTREPKTLEESLVAFLEEDDGCVKEGQAVIPPPDSCGKAVHIMHGVAEFHLLTLVLIFMVVGVLVSMTATALKG
jgi:hypothetical protein